MRPPRLAGRPGRREALYAAVVLGCQSLVALFGAVAAFGLAASRAEGWPLLWAGLGLAALCVVGAGVVRRPWGVTFGWLLQAATFAWALVVPAMLAIAVIFLALWLAALVKGRQIDERDARLGLTP